MEAHSTLNILLTKLDEILVPSKNWGTHISNGNLVLLSIKPTSNNSLVELFKCIVLSENTEQQLQVNTSILQVPVKVSYLNYDIKEVSDLQSFINDFEKVQLCKYFLTVQNKTCETIGKNFSDICSNCEAEVQCNRDNSLNETLKCSECSELFSSLDAIKCHSYVFHGNHLKYTVCTEEVQKTVTEESGYVCRICGNRCDSSKELTIHEVTHFNGSFKCVVCHESFNCMQRLITHTKKYHPNVPFIKCHLCNKKFVAARYLRVHLRSHTNEHLPISCSKCTLKFNSQIQLELHEKFHKSNNFTCKKCKKTFAQNKELFLHCLVEHPKPYYPCRICNSGFEKKLHLIRHEQSHGMKLFECKPCSKRFNSYNEFVEHKSAHRSGNRYICPNCRQSFPTLDLAEQHTCSSKNYKCDLCNKEFTKLYTFKMHHRHHGMQKLFKCTVCKKAFSTKGNLAVHNYIHEREVSSSEGTSTAIVSAENITEEL